MTNYNPMPQAPGGGNSGPPGQNLLGILLAAATAVLGTPYLFQFIGPFVERLVYDAYGWRELAEFMYFVSFILCGGVIYASSRMVYWYILAAVVTLLSMRAAGMAVL